RPRRPGCGCRRRAGRCQRTAAHTRGGPSAPTARRATRPGTGASSSGLPSQQRRHHRVGARVVPVMHRPRIREVLALPAELVPPVREEHRRGVHHDLWVAAQDRGQKARARQPVRSPPLVRLDVRGEPGDQLLEQRVLGHGPGDRHVHPPAVQLPRRPEFDAAQRIDRAQTLEVSVDVHPAEPVQHLVADDVGPHLVPAAGGDLVGPVEQVLVAEPPTEVVVTPQAVLPVGVVCPPRLHERGEVVRDRSTHPELVDDARDHRPYRGSKPVRIAPHEQYSAPKLIEHDSAWTTPPVGTVSMENAPDVSSGGASIARSSSVIHTPPGLSPANVTENGPVDRERWFCGLRSTRSTIEHTTIRTRSTGRPPASMRSAMSGNSWETTCSASSIHAWMVGVPTLFSSVRTQRASTSSTVAHVPMSPPQPEWDGAGGPVIPARPCHQELDEPEEESTSTTANRSANTYQP